MKNLGLLLFLLPSFLSFGQRIPKKISKDPEKLALHLCADLDSEREKADAIYSWITSNIEYDYALTKKDKAYRYEGAEDVLKKKKTLCFGYSRLMAKMLSAVGIASEEVAGYTYAHKSVYKPDILLDNHMWIALKIDGQWKLADPTWDAGYIGDLAAKKWEDKLLKKQAKIEKKNEKLLEAGKDTLPHLNIDSLYNSKDIKGKQGFVFSPDTAHYLKPTEEFTLTHLPLLPMWQLSPGYISVRTFLQNDDYLKATIQEGLNKTGFDWESEINNFMAMNALEKALYTAETTYQFNPKNPRAKAYYLYHYLSILNDKEVQKYFRELDLSTEIAAHESIIDIADTTLAYLKLGKATEKERYKDLKNFYKANNKATSKKNRDLKRWTKKGLKWNEKAQKSITKNLEKLPSNIQKSKDEIAKSEQKFPDVANYNFNTIEVDLSPVEQFKDSLQRIETSLNTILNNWKTQKENTALQESSYLLERNYYLLKFRAQALQNKSISFNAIIDTIEFVLDKNFSLLDSSYNTNLRLELFNNDAFSYVKEANQYLKFIKTELKEKREKENMSDTWFMFDYFQARVNQIKEAYMEVASLAFAHCQFLEGHVNNFQVYWKKLEEMMEKQEPLSVAKNTYLVEQNDHEHLREEDLVKGMEINSKKWKTRSKDQLK